MTGEIRSATKFKLKLVVKRQKGCCALTFENSSHQLGNTYRNTHSRASLAHGTTFVRRHVRDRFNEAQFGIPRKEDPCIPLTSVIKLSTSGRPSGFAYTVAKWALGSISRTNFAVLPVSPSHQQSAFRPRLFVRHPFQNFQFSLILVLIGRHAHCIDQPDFQFTGDDRCRDETAPGDGDDRPPGAGSASRQASALASL